MNTSCSNSLICPKVAGEYNPRDLLIGDTYFFPYLKWFDTLSGQAILFPDGTTVEAAITYANGVLAYKWLNANIDVSTNVVQLHLIPHATTAALKPTKLGGERAYWQLRVTYPGDIARTWLKGRLALLNNRIPS